MCMGRLGYIDALLVRSASDLCNRIYSVLKTRFVLQIMADELDSPWSLSEEEDSFEHVSFPPNASVSLSPTTDCPPIHRASPMTNEEFQQFIDDDGRIVDEHKFRQTVFRGGVDPSIRRQVWRFLFGYYPFLSTTRERETISIEHHIKYNAMKQRWTEILDSSKSSENGIVHTSCDVPHSHLITAGLWDPNHSDQDKKQQIDCLQLQAQVFAARHHIESEELNENIRVIEKDVPRTDRDHSYFKGQDNPKLFLLRDILITFAAFHLNVGYAQGMNDLVSHFLVVLDSEVEAYWCFNNYMIEIQMDFLEQGMVRKLELLRKLLDHLDADLCRYLASCDVGDLMFCHRWLLLGFKREFNFEDAQKLFEILSSHYLEVNTLEAEKVRQRERSKDFEREEGNFRIDDHPLEIDYTFDLFMCVALLIHHRKELFECIDPASVFQFIYSLTNQMDLDDILRRSEALFFSYCQRSVADCFQVVNSPDVTSSKLPLTRKS